VSVGLQRLRDEPDVIRQGAIDKGEDPSLVDAALELDAERRRLLGETDGLRAERKELSAGRRRDEGRRPVPRWTSCAPRSQSSWARIAAGDEQLRELEAQLEDLLLRIPNPADPDVPVGGEEASVIVRTLGRAAGRTADGWQRRPHWEVGRGAGHHRPGRRRQGHRLGLPRLPRRRRRLQRALINLMLGSTRASTA
jgi:seryl-tRNA synthetase